MTSSFAMRRLQTKRPLPVKISVFTGRGLFVWSRRMAKGDVMREMGVTGLTFDSYKRGYEGNIHRFFDYSFMVDVMDWQFTSVLA